MIYQNRFPPQGSITSLVGFLEGSCFTLIYFFAPLYTFGALAAPLFLKQLGTQTVAKIWAPLVLSILCPPIHAPKLVECFLKPLLTFFEYNEIHETSDAEMCSFFKTGKSAILVAQPHGVLSLTGICSATYCIPEFRMIKTAAASAVVNFPFLKQVMGIFGLIDAAKPNLIRHLKKGGAEGTIVIYVGGIAELFMCSESEERLFLQKRKGFVKLALQTGTSLIPLYMFGNTTVLTPLKWKFLVSLSRKMQASMTYFWGMGGLPVPRKVKLVYCRGKMVHVPKIEEPTQADIDKYHKLYVDEVTRIYTKYQPTVCDGDYAKKKLVIE
ncbi:hypothetical protein ScalyP_jg11705 [Parmales sp. scaly parma]|nr:hypothetical protein ScalyP_jg11705 [Parmales sp. scaly parma]